MMKNKKGFTLVELLIYMALLTIFLLVLVDIFTTTLEFKLQSESTSVLNQDSRYILANLNYNIFNSGSATVISGTELSLNYGALVYQLVGNNLLLNSVQLNSSDTKVDSINFTKVGNTIRVTYTLESLIVPPGAARTQSVSTTLGLRY